MIELGKKWCAYRDEQNIAGNFVDNWGWTGDAWFYDGGRSFENIDTYTAAAGHANHACWQHCAINLLEPVCQLAGRQQRRHGRATRPSPTAWG